MTYIRVPAVWDKLRLAEETFRPVLMLATAGWGKTAAADYYYRKRAVLRLSGISGALDARPDPDRIRQGVILVDDISWITDPASQEYLLALLASGARHLVLIGRGHIPAWLIRASVRTEFVHISGADFILDAALIRKLFHASGVSLSEEDAALIQRTVAGYPPAVLMVLSHLKQGQPVSRALFGEIRIELFHYHEQAFWRMWKEPVRALLLEVCRYPSFSPEMASFLSGLPNVNELLEYGRSIGQFMTRTGPDQYVLLDEMRAFLCWKQDMLWSRERIAENYRKAAGYYLRERRISDALDCFEQAGATDRILEVLIANARRHPGTGYYDELQRHYQSLRLEDLPENPLLLSGICLLYSLLLRPEESEKAYSALAALPARGGLSPSLRLEAEARLALLDLSLPHRTGRNLPEAIRRLRNLCSAEQIEFPEFSLTDNCPSVLNGAFDFCAMDPTDLFRDVLTPLEEMSGPDGRGLTDIARGEIALERGEESVHAVAASLSRGCAAADFSGNMELFFAAQGLLIRYHVASGHFSDARRNLELLEQKIQERNAVFLLPGFRALKVWLSLYEHPGREAQAYLTEGPDPRLHFYIMNRFCYRIRLRCLIALGQYPEALDLSAYLSRYYEEYGRIYLSIENDFLRAVLLFRTGQQEWQHQARLALKRAERYGLTRVISMEGAAALPLLTRLGSRPHSGAFREKLLRETRAVALAYPNYLQGLPPRTIRLTGREQEILSMLCGGRTTGEICDSLSIGYSALKKHNRSIYEKLGVRNREEAVRAASRLGIVCV